MHGAVAPLHEWALGSFYTHRMCLAISIFDSGAINCNLKSGNQIFRFFDVQKRPIKSLAVYIASNRPHIDSNTTIIFTNSKSETWTSTSRVIWITIIREVFVVEVTCHIIPFLSRRFRVSNSKYNREEPVVLEAVVAVAVLVAWEVVAVSVVVVSLARHGFFSDSNSYCRPFLPNVVWTSNRKTRVKPLLRSTPCLVESLTRPLLFVKRGCMFFYIMGVSTEKETDRQTITPDAA